MPKACPLFAGIDDAGLSEMLKCLSAARKAYEKNSFIFTAGEPVTSIGIVLSGSVHIMREDFWGNRTIVARVEPGGLFGEAFSCAGLDKLPVSAAAASAADIMQIDYRRVISPCPSVCEFHSALIKNMLRILAEKNVLLMQKMEFITQRTTREKLLAYLSAQAQLAKSSSFKIPFNRQELADYLAVDRSAMSSELSKMRDEGILAFRLNSFELFRR